MLHDCLGGEIGRRTGLKILGFLYRVVPVRFRPEAPLPLLLLRTVLALFFFLPVKFIFWFDVVLCLRVNYRGLRNSQKKRKWCSVIFDLLAPSGLAFGAKKPLFFISAGFDSWFGKLTSVVKPAVTFTNYSSCQ